MISKATRMSKRRIHRPVHQNDSLSITQCIFTWVLVESHVCFWDLQESLEVMKEMEGWMERTKQPKSYRGTPLLSFRYLSYIRPQPTPCPPVVHHTHGLSPQITNQVIPDKASAALSMLGYAAKDKGREPERGNWIHLNSLLVTSESRIKQKLYEFTKNNFAY